MHSVEGAKDSESCTCSLKCVYRLSLNKTRACGAAVIRKHSTALTHEAPELWSAESAEREGEESAKQQQTHSHL